MNGGRIPWNATAICEIFRIFCLMGNHHLKDAFEDIEEMEELDASEIHTRRLRAKEVLTPMKSDNFMFPVADGAVEISGGDQPCEHPPESGIVQNEENQTGSLLQPHFKMTRENSFIVITLNPESDCTCREKKHFLFQ